MQEFSVTEFHREMNKIMKEVHVAIVGEVSDFNISNGKFVWFTLKDKGSAMSCFMMSFQLKVPLEDGMEIRVVGEPAIFPRSGKYVFKPRSIELVGEGALKRAFEVTKAQLEEEGLFDEERKRSLPNFPENVGIITSQDAAAYTDFLRILNSRWAGVNVLVFPVSVQGVKAIPSISDAFRQVNESFPHLDAVVLTRGGGSMEDLQAFNSEEVARAVFGSKVPVICGVGHERDTSLADYVADVRAATPTHAAELLVPNRSDFLQELQGLVSAQRHTVEKAILSQRQLVDRELFQLEHIMRDHLSFLKERISLFFAGTQAFLQEMRRFQTRIEQAEQTMIATVKNAIQATRQHLGHQEKYILTFFSSAVTNLKSQLEDRGRLLKSLNPKAVLARGYSMTTLKDGTIVRDPDQVKKGDDLKTELEQGIIHSRIT